MKDVSDLKLLPNIISIILEWLDCGVMMSSGTAAVSAFMCEYISTQKPSLTRLTRLFEENHVMTEGWPMLQPATGGW